MRTLKVWRKQMAGGHLAAIGNPIDKSFGIVPAKVEANREPQRSGPPQGEAQNERNGDHGMAPKMSEVITAAGQNPMPVARVRRPYPREKLSSKMPTRKKPSAHNSANFTSSDPCKANGPKEKSFRPRIISSSAVSAQNPQSQPTQKLRPSNPRSGRKSNLKGRRSILSITAKARTKAVRKMSSWLMSNKGVNPRFRGGWSSARTTSAITLTKPNHSRLKSAKRQPARSPLGPMKNPVFFSGTGAEVVRGSRGKLGWGSSKAIPFR